MTEEFGCVKAEFRKWDREIRNGSAGLTGPGADQGWGEDDAFGGGDFLAKALLEGGKVKFGGGGQMEFLDGREEALQNIGDQGEADEFGTATHERIHAHGGGGKSGVEINLMEFQAELHTGSGGDKSLADEGNGAIKGGSGRQRAAVGEVEFLEDGEAAGTKMALELAKSGDGIWIVHEDETANDGVEGFVEGHFGRVTFEEANVAHAAKLSAGNGPLNGGGDAVGADNFTAGTDKIGDEKGDVAATTADVENAHAGRDAGLEKELASERFVSLGLAAESMEFLL